MLSFNALAPLWAAPRWYPERVDPALLDRAFRRGRITAFLREAGRSRDIICLQEVGVGEMPNYEQALGGGFADVFASHDPAYWSNWLVPELPRVPNGNALFVRRAALTEFSFSDLSLGGTGDHAVMLSGVPAGSRRPLCAASVHLDADRNNTAVHRVATWAGQVSQEPERRRPATTCLPACVSLHRPKSPAHEFRQHTSAGSAAG